MLKSAHASSPTGTNGTEAQKVYPSVTLQIHHQTWDEEDTSTEIGVVGKGRTRLSLHRHMGGQRTPRTFLDERDAWLWADSILESLYTDIRLLHLVDLSIESRPLHNAMGGITNGGVTEVWLNGVLVGLVYVTRNEWNRSVATVWTASTISFYADESIEVWPARYARTLREIGDTSWKGVDQ